MAYRRARKTQQDCKKESVTSVDNTSLSVCKGFLLHIFVHYL